jgi:hypothetical protein
VSIDGRDVFTRISIEADAVASVLGTIEAHGLSATDVRVEPSSPDGF